MGWLRWKGRRPGIARGPDCAALFEGAPVTVRFRAELREHRGRLFSGEGPGEAVHAGTHIRKREIWLDGELAADRRELRRILTHELFHFAWVRLSNRVRRAWEVVLAEELTRRARGELGWSAEWRKQRLKPRDHRARSRRWRDYACESFCDTGAWIWSGLRRHDEFTLSPRYRARRRDWFDRFLGQRPIPI